MSSSPQNPVAIITGASRGIGEAIALGLAKKNYQVVLISRSIEKLLEVKKNIQTLANYKSNMEPLVFPMDITDAEHVTQAVKEIVKTTGRVDVLVNNAAKAKPGLSNLTSSDFEHLFKVNALAGFNFINAVSPIMKAQQRGYIINIGSKSALVASPEAGGYAVSKLCLLGLAENLAKELIPFGIKVSTINPGLVDTPLTDGIGVAKDKMLTKEDIVNTIFYLLTLSDNACIKDITVQCKFNY